MIDLLDIKGIGDKTKDKLNTLGITNVKELLEFMPTLYIDMSEYADMSAIEDGNYYRFSGSIVRINKISRGRGVNYFSVQVMTSGIKIKAIWYNQPYLYDKIKLGQEYTFFGKVKLDKNKWLIQNPLFEEKGKERRLQGILPIYRTQGLVNQANIRKFIKTAYELMPLRGITDSIGDIMNYQDAIELAHSPKSITDAYEAQRRLAIEDLVKTILTFRLLKRYSNKDKGRKYSDVDYNSVAKILPYTLSESQSRAISEIIQDLNKPQPMNRLLLGDVGSGKTVVAMIISYISAINGYQSALMAPTTILAKQHYDNFSVLKHLGINVDILTSDTKTRERNRILENIRNGKTHIVIGTQSIISKGVEFKSLGLVISDEMHRFGVKEKSDINSKGYMTDTLVMSATPIPRALALTIYEDLDTSSIDRHKDTNIHTHIVPREKIEDMYRFISQELDKGRQAYIVCPRIEDSEGIELVSAKAIYNQLKKGSLSKYAMELLHARLSDESKLEIMQDFKDNKTQVLVATTVVEVGIDNPNATIMVVMNADCFGLATLHQLRGRVGRGEHISYCLLTADNMTDRLRALKEHSNGKDIAEIDYELRGGGDFIGLRQKGRVRDNKYIVTTDKSMIVRAKAMADRIDIHKVKDMLIDDYEKIVELAQVVMN